MREISDINASRFSKGSVVELHGCNMGVVPSPGFPTLASSLSEHLPNSTVIGHQGLSGPGPSSAASYPDYRRGRVNVYKKGKIVNKNVRRGGVKF